MKWMIASDIHGSAYYCRKLLEAYEKEEAERLLLLGDILYHGPRNDLPEGYAPKEVIELLNARKNDIYCVRGNCDTEVDQMVLEFPVLADYCVIAEGETAVYATHGHIYNEQKLPPLHPGDISAARTHSCAEVRCTRRGILHLYESRIGVTAQGRQLAWIHDLGRQRVCLERF